MNFDVTVKVDSALDQFKIAESLIKTLYKNNQFNVDAGALDEGTFRLASYYKFFIYFIITPKGEHTYDSGNFLKFGF